MLLRHPLFFILLSSCHLLFSPSLHAYCAKCAKIEADREKEQREHPTGSVYYEDYLSNLREKEASLDHPKKPSETTPSSKKLQAPPLAALDDPYSEGLYSNSPANARDETLFFNQTQEHLRQLNQSNQNMIHRDQHLFQEGFDPNENYFGGASSNKENPGYSMPEQEAFLQGKNGKAP